SSVDVAHGLALLFGLGTKALPSWGFEDEVEQSFGRPRRQYDGWSKRTNDLTSSIVPRGTSFHRWVDLRFFSYLLGGLAVSMTAGPSGQTISPHPSSREGHHSTVGWSSGFSPIWFDPAQISSYCDFPSPPERGAVNPDAMHDHGQPTRQRHDRLLPPAMPGDLHRPRLEPGPFRRT